MCTWLSQHYYSINISTKRIPLVLEGGSIHTDGQGTILTTKECLLHPNRNPKLSQTEIESILLQELGCTKIIWLPLGLFGDDDTNGHVDNFACFSQPGHVLLSWTDDDEGDVENYKRCRQAHEVLNREIDAQGRALTIHKLHLPPPMVCMCVYIYIVFRILERSLFSFRFLVLYRGRRQDSGSS
jgi:agmatine deiminase